MWINPNWRTNKPPLRVTPILQSAILFSLCLGICRIQGQQFGPPPSATAFPQGQGPSSQSGIFPQGPQGQGTSFPPGSRPSFQQSPGSSQFQPGQVPVSRQSQQPQLQQRPFRQSPQGQNQRFQQGQPFGAQVPGGSFRAQPSPVQLLSPPLPPGFTNGSSFVNPGTPRAPLQMSSIINLGSQVNTQPLSTFRIWQIMADFLPTLPSHSPHDYVLSLQPQLIKGIPTFNISVALGRPLNPQVLKALVSQTSGMLPSQKAFIAAKLIPRLNDPNAVTMILGTEDPDELMTVFPLPILQKNMPVFVRALTDFTARRNELNLAKVRLLPTNFLSSLLKTLLGGDSLSVQNLRSRNATSDLASLALMGVNCHQIQSLPHDEIIPFLDMFNNQFHANRKQIPNLNFPINLRDCALDALLLHLATKPGDTGTNVLSRLEMNEIGLTGGEIFSGIPIQGLENLQENIRREVLIEIGQMENFDLLLLLHTSALRRYGSLLLNDISAMTNQPGQPVDSALPDTASLVKMGNLFCYADLLKGNFSKVAVRQLLESKTFPGSKSCCLDRTGQEEWTATLKNVFGPDVSAWKSADLVVIGDLLVALNLEDIGKLSVAEIGRVITPLLEGSGLNFPVHLPEKAEPVTFARACVSLLPHSSDYRDSFLALMRKYVLGSEMMVNFVQKMQHTVNARRVAREAPMGDCVRTQDSLVCGQETLDFDSHRYRRQAPMPPPPGMVQSQMDPRQQQPPGMVQGQMDPRQQQPPIVHPHLPETMATQTGRTPHPSTPPREQPQPPQFQQPPRPQFPQPPPPQFQQPSRPQFQQPPSPQFQQPPPPQFQQPPPPQFQQPPPPQFQQPPPPQFQQPPPPQFQQPLSPQFQQPPSQFQQPSPPQFQQPPAPKIQQPPQFQQPPAPKIQQPPQSKPGQSQQPPPTGAQAARPVKNDERIRSILDNQEPKLTCLGIKAAGPAAIGVIPRDLASLHPNDLRDCIETIGFVDWSESAKREILRVYKQKLNLTTQALTTVNLIELGNLVTALSTSGHANAANGLFSSIDSGNQDNLTPFDISAIDLSVPLNLDSVSVLGSQITDPVMLKVIGDKFTKDNGLDTTQVRPVEEHLMRATIWSLGNIVCGLSETVLKIMFDSSPTMFLYVSPLLGRLQGCEPQTLSVLAHYAVQPTNFGTPNAWTIEDVNTVGVVVAGLTPEALASISPLALEGLHHLAVQEMTPQQIQSLTPAHLGNLTYVTAKRVMANPKLLSFLSVDQIQALKSATSVDATHFNIPASASSSDAPTDDITVRSIEGEGDANSTTKNSKPPTNKSSVVPNAPTADESEIVETILAEPEPGTNAQGDLITRHAKPTEAPTTSTTTSTPKPASDSTASSSQQLVINSLHFVLLPVIALALCS